MFTTPERLILIGSGSLIATALTGTVCYAAILSLGVGDGGLQNLLFGGIIGTGGFGGGALFAALGVQYAQNRGTGGGPTVNVETNTADVRASTPAV